MHFRPMAYLDPGSGSFLIQLAIAALLGLGVALRASWGKIKGAFGIKPKPEDDDIEDEDRVDKSLLVLPTKCPSCGAAVRSNEVKWLDDITAECNYCKSPIRASVEN